jgi:hypothetical protein
MNFFNQQSFERPQTFWVCVLSIRKSLTQIHCTLLPRILFYTHRQTERVESLSRTRHERTRIIKKKKTDFKLKGWKFRAPVVCVHSRLLTWCVGCVRMRPKWLQSLDWTGPVRTTLVWDEYMGGSGWGLGRRRSVDSWRWRHLAIAFRNFYSFSFFFKTIEKYRCTARKNENKSTYTKENNEWGLCILVEVTIDEHSSSPPSSFGVHNNSVHSIIHPWRLESY